MIIHPDGRIEGTPEELTQYKEAQAAKQTKGWKKEFNDSLIGKPVRRCLGPCFCDGSCTGKGTSTEWQNRLPQTNCSKVNTYNDPDQWLWPVSI